MLAVRASILFTRSVGFAAPRLTQRRPRVMPVRATAEPEKQPPSVIRPHAAAKVSAFEGEFPLLLTTKR
jgi:hypothetical protein